jgi:vesicle-fusing ATPase
MVGYSEASKIQELNKVFSDSYKSPISVIVIDSIERILGEFETIYHTCAGSACLTCASSLDWNPIGPRFSNGALQALVVLLGKRPPKVRLHADSPRIPHAYVVDFRVDVSWSLPPPPIEPC